MMTISDFPTSLAWEFTHLLSGTFRRNKADFAHLEYPILAPLPTHASETGPREGSSLVGPFLYFVVDDQGKVMYVGKSMEINVLKRWIRPDNGKPASHYWTHSTKGGGCVFKIAEGLRAGRRYQLRYAPMSALQRTEFFNAVENLDSAERLAINALRPEWNSKQRRLPRKSSIPESVSPPN